MDVQVKRVYEAPEESDGFRILTDRLWPRAFQGKGSARYLGQVYCPIDGA